MTNDRVLVLGGTGFLGSLVVQELAARDARIVVLARRQAPVQQHVGNNVLIVRGDCADIESLRRAMNGCRFVVHSAGYYPLYSLARDPQAQQALTELLNVLNAASSAGVERFVFTSSPMVLAEDPAAVRRCTYHYIKRLLHEEVLRRIDKGFPALIAIPGACFAPGDRKPTTGRLIIEIMRGRLRFVVEGRMNVVDGRDVARAEADMLSRGSIGDVYQLGNWNCRVSEFASLVARLSGSPEPLGSVPYEAIRLIAKAVEAVQFPFGVPQPFVPQCGFDQAHYGAHLDSSPALRELNFRTRPVAETILDTIQYFVQTGMLRPRQSMPRLRHAG